MSLFSFRKPSLKVLAVLAVLPAVTLSACNRKPAEPTPPPSEAAGTTWLNDGVVLYMPDPVMKARIKVEDLSPYMQKVDEAAKAVAEAQQGQKGTSGMLLVAMRPGGLSKAWVVTGEPSMEPAIADAMVAAAETVPVPTVNEETVLVGIKFHAFGGGTLPVSAGPPIPIGWYAHFSKHGGLLDDELMSKVWPKEAAQ